MKQIVVTLDPKSISQAIQECEKFQKWLANQVPKFLEEVSKLGLQIANIEFQQAEYDGDNDVTCKMEQRGDNCVAIVATGNATLFIEFGTGIVYPDNHPEHPAGVVGRGEYGQGKGKNQSWGFYGGGSQVGTSTGHVAQNKKGKSVVITQGNPANMPMYLTVSQLQQEFERIARKVFDYK